MNYTVASFYALSPLPQEVQGELRQVLQDWPSPELPLRGTVLVAPDGINATIAGPETVVEAMIAWLRERLPLSRIKLSRCQQPPFRHWRVSPRRETVTSGPIGKVALEQGQGTHLSPQEWHSMLEQPGVTVIDVRNDYEIELGRFRGALDPQTHKFTEFVEFVDNLQAPKDQPLLTYCTGGIRCEKAVPYLRQQGFTRVYQLEGGILHYLEHFPDGYFEGECFVFDDRVALDGQLQPSTRYSKCPVCGQPHLEPGSCQR